MERLDFSKKTPYSAVEACIHLNRYAMAKPFCKNKRILDAACGEGYGSFLLRKWGAETVVGLDIDEQTVTKATELFGSEHVNFQCHTVEQLPFPDYYFDVVVSFETIEHLKQPELFLQEIRRVLRPGGVIIMSCPNDPYYYKEDNVSNPFHMKKYTWFDFKELAEKHLGNNVDYFLSFAVDGFLNMPISRSTEPSNAMPTDMTEMLNYVECSDVMCVKQERYLNHWNSNYYVGIWGGNEVRKNINSVIFPRETFYEIKDENVELLKEIEKWKDQKDEKAWEKEQAYADLKQKTDVEILKSERLSAMVELLNQEILCLRENYDAAVSNHELQNTRLLERVMELEQEDYKKQEDIIGLKAIEHELRLIKESKGWKLLCLLYKIEGIFRRA